MGQAQRAARDRGGIEEAARTNLGYLRGFMLSWLATVQAGTAARTVR
jgi:hypothetical protein